MEMSNPSDLNLGLAHSDVNKVLLYGGIFCLILIYEPFGIQDRIEVAVKLLWNNRLQPENETQLWGERIWNHRFVGKLNHDPCCPTQTPSDLFNQNDLVNRSCLTKWSSRKIWKGKNITIVDMFPYERHRKIYSDETGLLEFVTCSSGILLQKIMLFGVFLNKIVVNQEQ